VVFGVAMPNKRRVNHKRTNHKRTFGRVIASLRLQVGLTQEELADRAAVHATYISQIERGLKSPTLATITKLAAALGTTPSAIMRKVERLNR
jgi:transcriptional regulator with XRE-family HTH domain